MSLEDRLKDQPGQLGNLSFKQVEIRISSPIVCSVL